jgi:hypothetical protein
MISGDRALACQLNMREAKIKAAWPSAVVQPNFLPRALSIYILPPGFSRMAVR